MLSKSVEPKIIAFTVFTLFSPMVSGWAVGWAAGNSLSGLYLRNRKV